MSIRPLLDSVGFTLLCHLVFYPLLGAIYSAMEAVFIRFIDERAINPIHLPFWSEPISLIWLFFV